MSSTSTFDEIKSKILNQVDQLKVRILGQNNERLDFLIDSFSKLDQTQQKGVIAGLFAGIFLFVFLAFGIYFSQVSSLKSNLQESFEAIRQLETLSGSYKKEKRKFDMLMDRVKGRTGNVSSFKSHFEKISREESVTIGQLNEKSVKIPDTNPLSDAMNEVRVDVDVDNISLPKILKYVVAIEKSKKYLKVSDLKIRSRYGTKLYFDTEMSVKGYKVR